jgi:hypothetical protein
MLALAGSQAASGITCQAGGSGQRAQEGDIWPKMLSLVMSQRLRGMQARRQREELC